MIDDILSGLNQQQEQAVTYCDGPQLIIAGAGSGKTRVLTCKIAYLLQHGLAPWNILALTFTNKAANEMKQRIGAFVGVEKARMLNMGTFHSVFLRILRIEAQTIGFDSNFTIYDESDSRSLVTAIIKEMGLNDKTYRPSTVLYRIGLAKNALITPETYMADTSLNERDNNSQMPLTGKIYREYAMRCRTANAMDFDDMLLYTHSLLARNPDIRAKYADRFKYILVDEYQDTNYAQQCIISLLAQQHNKVSVVGDDAQSIYAFRGANIDNILEFQKTYPNAKLFKLEQNYRSTQNIVNAANCLIEHNRRQIKKNVFSHNEEGEPVRFLQTYSDKEEAAFLGKEIARLRRSGHYSYSDFCVLYRTNAQSRAIEEELRRQNLPYHIFGGLSFYQRKEIKDILAYFRLVTNPDDEEAFKRIINYPARGIGATTVKKIADMAHETGVSMWNVIADADGCGLNVNRGTLAKLDGFRAMIQQFITLVSDTDALQLGKTIIEKSGMSQAIFADKSSEGLSRQDNVGEFLSSLSEFVDSKREEGLDDECSLPHFLQEIALSTDADNYDNDTDGDLKDDVALMTVHASKGLEFPVVFIVGMEENLFPGARSSSSMQDLEEERRLFYVAITRAEKLCYITCARSRYQYGNMSFNPTSRFVNDIASLLAPIETATRGFSRQNAGRDAFREDSLFDRGTHDSDVYTGFRRETAYTPPRPTPSRSMKGNSVSDSRYNPHSALAPLSECGHEPTFGNDVAKSGVPGLAVGAVIEHQRFGIGKVLRIEGTNENAKATVEFQNVGVKQLLLKFAKYSVLE